MCRYYNTGFVVSYFHQGIYNSIHVVHSTLCHLPQHPRLRQVSHVDEDVVGRVSVERCAQSLLIEVVSDETDRATKHEQAIKGTNLNARQPIDVKTRRRSKP